eukprot:997063-Prymnesium_polylepis.1
MVDKARVKRSISTGVRSPDGDLWCKHAKSRKVAYVVLPFESNTSRNSASTLRLRPFGSGVSGCCHACDTDAMLRQSPSHPPIGSCFSSSRVRNATSGRSCRRLSRPP